MSAATTVRDRPRGAPPRWPLWLGGAILLGLVTIAFLVGQFPVSPAELVKAAMARLAGQPSHAPSLVETVIFQIRAPRIAAAIVVGAALAAAGAAYQGMFRNPLVSPDILGVSSGAALGAALAILFSLGTAAVQGFAFAGGLAAVAIVYAVASAVRRHDPILTLILAGVVIGTLFSALLALVKYLADPYNQLPVLTYWLLGSLAAVAPSELAAAVPLALAGLVPLVLLRWRMNLLSLPDDEARALGVNTAALRVAVVCAATVMTAASVAVSGVIGWVGLLVPHAARLLVGPDFARLLPLSMLIGACYLLAVDTLARTVAAIEVPPGVLTALIGTPVFLWLLATTRRGA
ncbi:FecCD family ABC transporter permease [Pelomicrobium methylotrophicum]|uniref:Iron ABC transporter permease n=1 Tax=Pelomicrobium methylotrophicum TaxID=2602750 RepID=A0A5C7EM33_9PROT|nr:iron ABC transporter permease [Pelomicrobium methylotrophicum]TXF12473.1 iron ABC transporter permease [Pelomicrobium methylotrophicum]